MPRVLTPQPGDVDIFIVHPDGAVFVAPRTPGQPIELGNAPELYAALSDAAEPADRHALRGAAELRVTHGYPPVIEWCYGPPARRYEPAPAAAALAFLMWLSAAVMRDAAASTR